MTLWNIVAPGYGPIPLNEGVGVSATETLLEALDDAGILTKLDGLWINNGSGALVNLKNPGTLDLTASGGPVLSSEGFTGDAVDAYLAPGYTPNGSGNYKLNDASVGAWITRQFATSINDYVVGAVSTDNVRIGGRATASLGTRSRLNNAANNDVYTVRGEGLTALRRNNSANYQVFKGGSLAGSIVAASSALPGAITFLRTTTVYSPSTIAAEWIGASLTDAEMATIYTLIGQCLVRLGVIEPYELYGALGAQTWFNDPRAIEVGGRIVTGSIAMDGSVLVDFLDSGVAGMQNIMKARLQVDDHNNPAFLRRASDNRLLMFYSGHNTASTYMRISTNPDDATAWDAEVNLDSQLGLDNYSYANVVQLSGEAGRIYLFFRALTDPNWTMHESHSDDGGATWSAGQAILPGGRPYLKMAQNGTSRIDFLVGPSPTDSSQSSVYHCYYEAGEYHDSVGNAIGPAPLALEDMTMVYSGATVRAWIWDIIIDGNGRPAILYVTFPSTSDHRLRRATFNGSTWSSEEVCTLGGAIDDPLAAAYSLGYYSGGACFGPLGVDDVIACRQVSSEPHQAYRYTKSGSWTGVQLPGTSQKMFRPFRVPGTSRVICNTGPYSSYELFSNGPDQVRVIELAL